MCHRCHKHADDAYYGCDCDEPLLMEDIPMSEILNGPGSENAGDSEPINDAGGFDETTEEELLAKQVAEAKAAAAAMAGEQPTEDTPEEQEEVVRMAVHLIMLQNGQFVIKATGEPNIGEMDMLLARAQSSVRSRMTAETVAQVLAEKSKPQSRIITPST